VYQWVILNAQAGRFLVLIEQSDLLHIATKGLTKRTCPSAVNMPLSLSQIFARNLCKSVASLLQQHFQYSKLFSSFICGVCQRLRQMKLLYFDQVAALTVQQDCSLRLAHCCHCAALQQLVINSGKAYDQLRILFQCQCHVKS
jgi:hypothetical protein